MMQNRKVGSTVQKKRNQMRESLSLHPVAWAMSVAETMTQRWLGTGCLCGGQGSAEGWKGHHGTEEEGAGGEIKMRVTHFQIQGTFLGGQKLEPELTCVWIESK